MRKNSIRKLIHGILDLLPLFVIPIFAININQKEVEPISITIDESYWEVQNLFESNEVNTTDDIIQGNIYYMESLAIDTSMVSNTFTINFYKFSYMDYNAEDGVMLDEIITDSYDSNISNRLHVMVYQDYAYVYFTNEYTYANFEMDTSDFYFEDVYFVVSSGINNFINYFDNYGYSTTDIYESDYSVVNYVYHESEPVIYDNTDIGSQFLYSLYISTDKYFNMNNVFNLNSVYQWFEINIFGGNAPLSIYIVWNIIIYELVMDLLMLLYALFMFFIDMCQKLIDKPLNSIK